MRITLNKVHSNSSYLFELYHFLWLLQKEFSGFWSAFFCTLIQREGTQV